MKKILIILFLALLIMAIPVCHASEGDINLNEFPSKLGEALGIDLFSARMLSSLIFMMLFLFPAMLIAGYFGGAGAVLYTVIIVGLASSGVCAFLGWFPPWLYAIMCLALAVMWGAKFTGLVGGEKS